MKAATRENIIVVGASGERRVRAEGWLFGIEKR